MHDNQIIRTSLSEPSLESPASDVSIVTHQESHLPLDQAKYVPPPLDIEPAEAVLEDKYDSWGISSKKQSKMKKAEGIASRWPPDE